MTNIPLTGEFRVTCEFGRKNTDKLKWAAGFHPGIDLVGSDTIYSTCDGIVVNRGYDNSYGNFIVIKNDVDGKYHWFCHLSKISKYRGTKVTRTTVIGIMGATGRVTAKHLHYEIRNQSNKYGDVSNPAEYMGIPNKVGTYNSKNYPINKVVETYTKVTTDTIFDADLYYSLYPDLQKAFGRNEKKLKEHFIKYGIKEGRIASYVFNPYFYSDKYPDLKKAFGTNCEALYNHFINNGIQEGRQGSVVFDVNYYFAKNYDLQKAFGTDKGKAVKHFVTQGIKEYRETSQEFNVTKYKANYPDLQKAFGNNCKDYYKHYIIYGIKEGRKTI